MSAVRKSLLLQLLESYLGLILQVISGAVIARLLTPAEVGVFSVAAVLVAMASQFRDFGLGEYIIQAEELTQRRIRAAFAVNIAVSWFMAAVLVGSSWAVADFYREPGVGQVMRLQALGFLIVPFGAVTMAYFRRELRYKPLFIAGQCANLVAFGVAVGGALAGLGYMSMAWSSLAGLVVTVLVSVLYRPAGFPRWPSWHGVGEVVAFSKHAMGIYFVGQIGKGAPEAVIGRLMDMASVAFYSRANGLMEIFNRTVLRAALPICLPYFSKAVRAGQSTAPGYLSATQLLTGVGWPFFLVIGVLSFSTIRLLYGAQWTQAVPLAQVLCVAAAIELPYWLTKEVLIAVGRIDRANGYQFQTQGLRLLGLLVGVMFGLTWACWGLCVAGVIAGWVSQRRLHETIGLSAADLLRACRPSALTALLSVAPVFVAAMLVPQSDGNYLWFLLLGGGASVVVWLLALRFTRHLLWDEIGKIGGALRARFRPAAR